MPWITVDVGENPIQVWVPDAEPAPVSAAADPELPQPQPTQYQSPAVNTPVSNNAATTGNGTSTPSGNQSGPTATTSTADITAQIRGELSGGPQNQGYLNLILNKYSAEDLANAYPEFGNAEDYRVAKNGLPKDLIVPGSLDAEGRVQAVQGTTEFIQADQIARQASREALQRAGRDYGVDFFISDGSGPGVITAVVGDRIFLDLPGGKAVDITS